jgi:hypothetical protein
MTEAEWLACSDPWPMRRHLFESGQGTDRKLRLFACACCRHLWETVPERWNEGTVETCERYADGLADEAELTAMRRRAHAVAGETERMRGGWAFFAARVPFRAAQRAARTSTAACEMAVPAVGSFAAEIGDDPAEARAREQRAQADLLRDIFGTPMRPPPFDPAWRTPAVLRMAAALYEGRTFDGMPFLGDALEEAGCADPEILHHCRGDAHHARGCWIVDAALGRR